MGRYCFTLALLAATLLATSYPVPAIEWDVHVLSDLQTRDLHAADVDADGDLDIVGGNWNDDWVKWWENPGNNFGMWDDHHISNSADGCEAVESADMDLDGDLDILAASYWSGHITWFDNLDAVGGSWEWHVTVTNTWGARDVEPSDLDNDGDWDFVASRANYNYMHPAEGQVFWMENLDGIGMDWQLHNLGDWMNAYVLHLIDLDQDGDDDILAAVAQYDGNYGPPTTGKLLFWENLSPNMANWPVTILDQGDLSVDFVGTADFNGDGLDDIFVSSWGYEENGLGVVWLEHDGSLDLASWELHRVDPELMGPLNAVDVDRDGDVDLVINDNLNTDLYWLENVDGVGDHWISHIINPAFAAYQIRLADLDGDGDKDLYASERGGERSSFLFEQIQTPADSIELTLTPTSSVELPGNGGTLEFDVHLQSTTAASMDRVLFWTRVKLPNGRWHPPHMHHIRFPLIPFMNVTASLTLDVPEAAPDGGYELWGYIGQHPNDGFKTGDFIDFSKGAPVADEAVEEWNATGKFGWGEIADEQDDLLFPAAYEMASAYPNPFNATTTLSVSLPFASKLNVSVFNVMGQQVGLIANGNYTAGTHNLVFDASGLASGVYFIRAQVPDHLNQMQKVMLVR